jgi:hypothetical protein
MQPVEMHDGVARFKANRIVALLLDTGKLNLNDLARMEFSDEDRMQLAQLIGYSVSGYGELSYVSDASYAKAQRQARKLTVST